MVTVADASVAIRADMGGFESDLKRAEGATKASAGRMQLTFKNILKAGALFGLGNSLTGMIQGAIRTAGDAAQAFGELEQTVATIDQVFGESAGVIRNWGETAAETAGMSQQTFMSSAAVMGQTLQNMGFTIEDSAARTVELLGRAADMALAFGKRPQDALLAITAAMRGERDTIEKFGVAIKQVDVNAKIAALGLDTSTAAAKKYAEAVAVVDLVLEQSEEHAGRFAASQGDVAVEMAEAGAKIEDFMTTQVGPAVASIQLGAVKVGTAFAETTEGIGMFFDNIFSPEKQAQVQMLADTWGVSFNEAKERIQEDADAVGLTWENQLAYLVDVTETTAGEVEETSRRIPRGVANALEEGAKEVGTAAEYGISDPVFDELLATEEAAGRSGHQAVIEYAKGLLTPQTDVQVAIEAALQVVEDEMGATEEYAYLSGQKTVLEEARGIAEQEGKDAAVIAIDGALALIQERMDALAAGAYISGQKLVASYVGGMYLGMPAISDAAYELANRVYRSTGIQSEPADHSSPLYGITKWGGNLVKTYAEGIYDELGTASGAAGALAGALVPSLGGASLGMAGVAVMPSGGNTYVLHVNGVPYQVGSPEEMIEKLMELGVMSEARLA